MDFLEHLAVHQSSGQIEVLHFVVNTASILFVPFASYLFGALLLSLYYGRIGRLHNDSNALMFSKEVLDHLISTKSILFLFGVVPYLTILLGYAQLLQETSSISVSLLTWGILSFGLAAAFAASYNSAMKLHSVLEHVPGGSDDVKQFSSESGETQRTAGKYAIIFLLVSVILYVCGTTLAARPGEWNDAGTVFNVLFSVDFFIHFVQFVLVSVAIASLGTIFFTFSWQGGREGLSDSYSQYCRKHALTIAMVSILAQPLMIGWAVVIATNSEVTGNYFTTAFFALLFLFVAAHFVYGMMKEFKVSYVGNAFFAFALVIVFMVLQDNYAFSSATRNHSSMLAYEFEKYHEGLLTELGVSLNVVTGEDIWNAKCSACHMFGKKKIGPAYKDVLPKYEGHMDQLIAFISNPVKKNPAFPNMPNQGLKPAEVDSIAHYIMKMYKIKQ